MLRGLLVFEKVHYLGQFQRLVQIREDEIPVWTQQPNNNSDSLRALSWGDRMWEVDRAGESNREKWEQL